MFSLFHDPFPSIPSNPSYNMYGGLLPDIYDGYYEPYVPLNFVPGRQASTDSNGLSDSSKFKLMLNVKHFRPDEIEVKMVDNFVVIHGKHEEQADMHGFVSREFTRRYQLPDDVLSEKVSSSLSQDGVLTIQAPRKVIELPKNERIVPMKIQKTALVEQIQKVKKAKQAQQQAQEEKKK